VLLKGVSIAWKVTSLSNTEVKSSKPKYKEYNLSDGDGLTLGIKPSDSRLWLFNYYHPFTRKRTNIGFRKYPNVSLANAKRKSEAARILLSDDIYPKTHKEENNLKQQNKISLMVDMSNCKNSYCY